MDQIRLALTFITAVERADWLLTEKILADDFCYFGPLPDAVDKPTFLAFLEAIKQGLPDLSFHVIKVGEHDDQVDLNTHITGTHTQTLTLPLSGISPLAQTRVQVKLPGERIHFRFHYDLIREIHTSSQMHRQVFEVLEQLGVEM